MYKKTLCALVVGSIGLVGLTQTKIDEAPKTTAQATKMTKLDYTDIIFVNMQDAMLQCAQGKEAQKIVESEERKYAEMAQKEQQRGVQLKNELDTKATIVTADERRRMEKELKELERGFQGKMKDWQEELQYCMHKETDLMVKEIEQAARTLAQNLDMAAVIDAPTGRVLYLKDDKNSTPDLVTLLDQQYTIKLTQKDKDTQSTVLASKEESNKKAVSA